MQSDRLSNRRRYLAACVAAALVTAFLLFVMTQLITPIGGDPTVETMLLQLETINLPPDAPNRTRASVPPESEPRAPSGISQEDTDLPTRPERAADEDRDAEPGQAETTDWWAQLRDAAESMDSDQLEEWLQSPENEDWVSVMQGPMPSFGGFERPPAEDSVWSMYRNVYGDTEIKVSPNCVLQIQSKPFDYSDFAKNIPPLVFCNETPVIDLSGLEEYIGAGRTP